MRKRVYKTITVNEYTFRWHSIECRGIFASLGMKEIIVRREGKMWGRLFSLTPEEIDFVAWIRERRNH